MAERPQDPELLAAISMARRLSRRRFLTTSSLGLSAAVLGPSLLAACGSDSDSDSSSEGATAGTGDSELIISNWDAYIDEDDNGNVDGDGTTIARFSEENGVKVTYKKDFNDNDEYFNKVYSPILGKGKRINPDITVPTYWMAARIIGLGWTEELLLDEIPNHANLEDNYLNLDWNPGATNFMPWQAGIAGIAYNPAKTGGDLKSMNDLYDEKLKGQVTMLTEWRDTVGLTMMGQGASASEANMDDINAALDKIEEATQSGQILKFTGNEYLRSLENGDIAACVAWSGDIAQLDPELGIKFVIPEEGGTQWFDAMTVAKGALNTVAAAKWMNFVYDPENAATITEFVQYISPVKGVREVLEARGGDSAALAENPLIFPDAETTERLQVFGSLSEDDEVAVQTRFNDITG
jgi:spermidine/putrescine transport system substrate-binding protein